ncbi:DNA-polymerase III subunit epsilon [Sesbania bispinosa]|nr:DNA-polymerase III subunit epsilon [Sesbania bispinosa]
MAEDGALFAGEVVVCARWAWLQVRTRGGDLGGLNSDHSRAGEEGRAAAENERWFAGRRRPWGLSAAAALTAYKGGDTAAHGGLKCSRQRAAVVVVTGGGEQPRGGLTAYREEQGATATVVARWPAAMLDGSSSKGGAA